jgi:hypothetical protein
MRRAHFLVVALVVLAPLAACSLTKRAPGTCRVPTDCAEGWHCQLDEPRKFTCIKDTPDGGEPQFCSDTRPCPDGGPSQCDDGGLCVECLKKQDCTGATKLACDLTTKTCVGCTDPSDCSGTPTPACDMDANTCVECLKKEDCTGTKHACLAKMCVGCLAPSDCGGTTPACDMDAKTCVGCLAPDDCHGTTPICDMPAKTCVACLEKKDCGGTKPICEAKACRACKTDSECADPGICLEDGHCATSNEVVYVDESACAAATPDGSTAKPYCAPNDAIAALGAQRRVVVLRGTVGSQVTLNVTAVSPVLIGREDANHIQASVPATNKTAISITAGDVLIRDLDVSLGSNPSSSKGIVATGIGTTVRLLRVRIGLGTGLGIQADTGADFQMDRCLVQNNSGGGILINGSRYDIQNTVIANNGYGIKFAAASNPASSRFAFNTVVMNTGNAATCDTSNRRSLVGSIVAGAIDSCDTEKSTLSAPTFDSQRPFHLTGSLPCPNGDPAPFPDHDFDGDLRKSPVDCGADQFVP